MIKDLRINKVQNGYIILDKNGITFAFESLDKLFNHLLLIFEGRSTDSTASSFGEVTINREKPKK